MQPELVATDDLVRQAVTMFLRAEPRAVALAGGSTPRPVYERLRTAFLGYPWHDVDVFFGDERCVPPDHPDSNFRMANEAFLEQVRARVHPMPGETCDPAAYEEELRSVFGADLPRFDFVFLGIGEDGHTASLFPGDPALEETDRWVARTEGPEHPRLTLTLPVLDAAKLVVFLVEGERKREVLRRLLAGEDLPAGRVAATRMVVVADRAAAP